LHIWASLEKNAPVDGH